MNAEENKQQSLFNYYTDKDSTVVSQVGNNSNNRTINHFVSTQKNSNSQSCESRNKLSKSYDHGGRNEVDDEDEDDNYQVVDKAPMKPPIGGKAARNQSTLSKSIGIQDREGKDDERSNADTESAHFKKQSSFMRKSHVTLIFFYF